MKRLIILAFLCLSLGTAKSQGSFYLSIDSYAKMSFNSTNSFVWDSKTAQVSDLFSYEHCSYCLTKPLRFGVTGGFQISNRHGIEIGIHSDGVSSKTRLRFASYQPYVDLTTPVYILNKSQSTQSRIFLNYKYALHKKPNKTSLSISPCISIGRRAGPKGEGGVGEFSSTGILIKDSLIFNQSSADFTTYSKYAFQFGLGLSSDLYLKGKYWFSLSLLYSHTKTALYFEQTKMQITNVQNGVTSNYLFGLTNRASGFYFGVSRKFQIIPWKGKSKNKSS